MRNCLPKGQRWKSYLVKFFFWINSSCQFRKWWPVLTLTADCKALCGSHGEVPLGSPFKKACAVQLQGGQLTADSPWLQRLQDPLQCLSWSRVLLRQPQTNAWRQQGNRVWSFPPSTELLYVCLWTELPKGLAETSPSCPAVWGSPYPVFFLSPLLSEASGLHPGEGFLSLHTPSSSLYLTDITPAKSLNPSHFEPCLEGPNWHTWLDQLLNCSRKNYRTNVRLSRASSKTAWGLRNLRFRDKALKWFPSQGDFNIYLPFPRNLSTAHWRSGSRGPTLIKPMPLGGLAKSFHSLLLMLEAWLGSHLPDQCSMAFLFCHSLVFICL